MDFILIMEGEMPNLTSEQIADGWKHISEIVNEPDGVLIQEMEYRNKNSFFTDLVTPMTPKRRQAWLDTDFRISFTCRFYRRLIPALPNQVVISRGDAEAFIEFAVNGGALYSDESVCLLDTAVTRLRAKLEGK